MHFNFVSLLTFVSVGVLSSVAFADENSVDLHLSGYVQPQMLVQTASNAPGYSDMFRVRRARLKTEVTLNDMTRFVLEVEPFPSGGSTSTNGTMLRQTEAQLLVNWGGDVHTQFGAGIFKLPFGAEVLESDADRPFIERSWGERNMTPGEYDTGAHAYTTLLDNNLTVQAAVVNGTTIGQSTFTSLPAMHNNDVVGRVNYNFGNLNLGVSGYTGNGNFTATGGANRQSVRAANFELGAHANLFPALGSTRLYAELTLGSNMDRGVNYSFAVSHVVSGTNQFSSDTNQQSMFVRVEQSVTNWVTLGVRYDRYTPDTNVDNNARETYAAVGAVHFNKQLKLMVEYDHSLDNVHAATGQAPSRQIDSLSTVLQARF